MTSDQRPMAGGLLLHGCSWAESAFSYARKPRSSGLRRSEIVVSCACFKWNTMLGIIKINKLGDFHPDTKWEDQVNSFAGEQVCNYLNSYYEIEPASSTHCMQNQ